MMEYNIKDDFDDFNVKRKKSKKNYCPYCHHRMNIKILNGFKYCDVCHEQLPGFVLINDFDKPVKELK